MNKPESPNAEESVVDLSKEEEKDVKEHVPQRTPVIFEIVRRSGEEELNRPWLSLWWSGIAAGLSMSFSLLAEALLHDKLVGVPGAEFLSKFGYCVGFLIVILARQQLFTENTLTSVVPLIAHFSKGNLKKFGSLWGTVLLANVIGTVLFAYALAHEVFISTETASTLHSLSLQPFNHSPLDLLARGIAAGFIIASLVWILANTNTTKVGIIVIMTYLVTLGDFAHIIAGTTGAAFLVFDGTITFATALTGFFIPALVGNVVGGTLLFTMLTYGQTRHELNEQHAS